MDGVSALMRECEINMRARIEEVPHLVSWLINYTPPAGKGFQFSDHDNVKKICKLTESDEHSGASFGLCLRAVQTKLRHEVRWGHFKIT